MAAPKTIREDYDLRKRIGETFEGRGEEYSFGMLVNGGAKFRSGPTQEGGVVERGEGWG